MNKKALIFILLLCAVAVIGGAAALLSKLPASCKIWVAEQIGLEKNPAQELLPGQPKPYSGTLNSLAAINIRNGVLKRTYEGLDHPWAMEFISDTDLLITELKGVLSRLDITTGERAVIKGLPDIAAVGGQTGLLDIALDPNFSSNGRLYFSYTVHGPNSNNTFALALGRAKLVDDSLQEIQEILVATPYGKSKSNFGGAIEFDQQGNLYLATGDRAEIHNTADLAALTGKVLRIDTEGNAVAGNPFSNTPNTDDRIYAYGVRNPQGLVFDSQSNTLYSTEHGPMGGDEVNRIEAGKNYGWPSITYGSNYTYQRMGIGTQQAGMEQPLFYYLPSLAISPITIYRGSLFPEWDGDLLVGSLKANIVSKLDLVDSRIISEHRILNEMPGRIRDIKVAGDGSLYFLSEMEGALTHLTRDTSSPELEQLSERDGFVVYNTICASCHSANLNGIPQLSDKAEWRTRQKKGMDVLFQHTRDGFNAMPEKGLCENCSDKELRAAVEYIANKALQSP